MISHEVFYFIRDTFHAYACKMTSYWLVGDGTIFAQNRGHCGVMIQNIKQMLLAHCVVTTEFTCFTFMVL